MQLPHIHHRVRDRGANVTYDVLAYRQLTQQEVLQSVWYHQAQLRRRRRKADRNCEVTIVTTHG